MDTQLTMEAWEEHGILNSDGNEIMTEGIKRERVQTLSLIEPPGKCRKKVIITPN